MLTVADIRAVGPKIWNGWKATLLRELYWRTAEEILRRPASAGACEIRVAAAQEALARELADWTTEEFDAISPAAIRLLAVASTPRRWRARPG